MQAMKKTEQPSNSLWAIIPFLCIFMKISGYHVCLVDEVNIKVNTRTLVASQGG